MATRKGREPNRGEVVVSEERAGFVVLRYEVCYVAENGYEVLGWQSRRAGALSTLAYANKEQAERAAESLRTSQAPEFLAALREKHGASWREAFHSQKAAVL